MSDFAVHSIAAAHHAAQGYGHVRATPIAEMLDSAVDNIEWGKSYLHDNPVEDSTAIMDYLSDSIETINLFKHL